jgi:hypothetical protein
MENRELKRSSTDTNTNLSFLSFSTTHKLPFQQHPYQPYKKPNSQTAQPKHTNTQTAKTPTNQKHKPQEVDVLSKHPHLHQEKTAQENRSGKGN